MVPLDHVSEIAFKAIAPHTGAIVARSIAQVATNQCGVDLDHASPNQLTCLEKAMESGIRTFVADRDKADACIASLRAALPSALNGGSSVTAPGTAPAERSSRSRPQHIKIDEEYDIVTARGNTRELCAALGFHPADQVKIATIVSELARNIVQYAGRGSIEIREVSDPRTGIEIKAEDHGPGIPDVELIMSGTYRSRTGMGIGIIGTKRLMDDFSIVSAPGRGTTIITKKYV